MSADVIDFITAQSFEWYDDIIFYLIHGNSPPTLDFKKCRTLRLKATPYHFVDNVLVCKIYDGVFLSCIEKLEVDILLVDLHAGLAGGHYSGETTSHKVLREGYYWPTMLKYTYNIVRKCEPCQKCVGKLRNPAFPLQPVIVQYPFQQWGMDFVSPISPPSSLQHKYILNATYYFT